MRIVVVLMAWLLLGTAHAQQPHPRIYQQAELDALLAPIALHPDGLLSQILIAATYPDEVAAAARWSRANPHLRGEDAVRAVQGEPWDPSVKALLAFPDLLARMDESPQWLHDLGEAFLLQEAHVMATVQGLRQRAQAAGQLTSTDQYAVYQQGEAIVVEPRTQIVYVRYYDPFVVYGPWWWPHHRPVFWHPWAPHPVFVAHGFFFSKPDWHHRHVRVVHRPVHVRQHHHTDVVPGKWQHRKHVVVKPHIRVPEAQRQPIVNSAPLAAPQVRQAPRRPIVQSAPTTNVRPTNVRPHVRMPEAQRQPIVQSAPPTSAPPTNVRPHIRVPEAQRQPIVNSAPPTNVRPHVRMPEAPRQPIVHSAPLASPVAREAARQPMPAANGFSHQRKEVRQPREHRKEFGHREGGGLRKHRD